MKTNTVKANELRIGNWVNIGYDCNVVRIDEFGATLNTYNGVKDLLYFHQTDIRPIHLTKVWLEKLGFVNNGLEFSNCNIYEKGDYRLLINKDHSGIVSFTHRQISPPSTQMVEVLYVHQLQNLYFALTGEELTIKPTEI